jgi:hypothetical protein
MEVKKLVISGNLPTIKLKVVSQHLKINMQNLLFYVYE